MQDKNCIGKKNYVQTNSLQKISWTKRKGPMRQTLLN